MELGEIFAQNISTTGLAEGIYTLMEEGKLNRSDVRGLLDAAVGGGIWANCHE